MLKIALFVAASAVVVNGGIISAHSRMRRNAATAFGGQLRAKRQTVDGSALSEQAIMTAMFGETFNASQIQCISKCESKLEKMKQYGEMEMGSGDGDYNADGDDDVFSVDSVGEMFSLLDTFAANHTGFNETQFEMMCSDFIDANDCVVGCGSGLLPNMMRSAFRPLEYMCIVNKEEFKKYADCGMKNAESDECDNRCGDGEDIDGASVESPLELFGELCTMVSCQLNCTKPLVVAACKDERAGVVFEQFMSHLIGGSLTTLKMLGLDPSSSDECQPVVAIADPLPSQLEIGEIEVPPGGIFGALLGSLGGLGDGMPSQLEQLQTQVAQLQLQLLEKQLVKADLETQLLQLQLAKEQKCGQQC